MDNRPVVLLSAPDPVKGELARGLLEEAGIPSLFHGPDRDVAELGAAVHMAFTRPDLLVPAAALEDAREVLKQAWGEEIEEL
ncbi:MAG: DUF2007 domain-containing protein [Planctomycetes bacterium]|nr:DUF2007 domain-containing protein [Planctomycetota bacterium]